MQYTLMHAFIRFNIFILISDYKLVGGGGGGVGQRKGQGCIFFF